MEHTNSRLRSREGVTTVLWDLDGTLVGIRQRSFNALMPFIAAGALRKLMSPWRFLREVNDIVFAVRANTSAMTNYELMVQLLAECANTDTRTADVWMRHLAEVGFPRLRRLFHPVPAAQAAVAHLAGLGISQVIATNPLWPTSTVTDRLIWGGFDPGVFEYVTSGETMGRSKPRIAYYRELLDALGRSPAECVMVGNSVVNDSPARTLGIPVFILGNTGGWNALPEWLGLEEAPCSSW